VPDAKNGDDADEGLDVVGGRAGQGPREVTHFGHLSHWDPKPPQSQDTPNGSSCICHTSTLKGLTSYLVIALFASLLGVLIALIAASSNVRKRGAKVRALIASDQAILQSLPPGSPAAIQLDARIQATVTMYARNLILPSARRGAAVMAGISLALFAGALTLALKNHSSQGDQFVYPLVGGLFAANVVLCLRTLLHRNLIWATPDPAESHVEPEAIAEDDDNVNPTEKAADQPV
jgi:hypothetical protein